MTDPGHGESFQECLNDLGLGLLEFETYALELFRYIEKLTLGKLCGKHLGIATNYLFLPEILSLCGASAASSVEGLGWEVCQDWW